MEIADAWVKLGKNYTEWGNPGREKQVCVLFHMCISALYHYFVSLF